MIFKVIQTSTKKELDRVTLTETSVRYETGAAKDVVQGKIDMFGRRAAIDLLRSWSNGYISTAEIDS
jgi:hypothetical protein